MKINRTKLILTLGFALYFSRALIHPSEYLAIYMVDFVFHEAGHLVFSFLGELVRHLGGTIMQLLIPCALVIHFLRQEQPHSASLMLFWLGENFANISNYARDARARLLPLHGGDAVTHDWSEILYTLNLLHHDQAVGNIFWTLGLLSMLAGLGFGIYFACFAADRNNFHAS